MAWIADIIPTGRRNRPGDKIVPKYITVHDTGNSSVGANAVAHGAFLRLNPDPVTPPNVRSWHATVDDTNTVQHLLFNEKAYHTGNNEGNNTSIGIEICQNADGNRLKAEKNAAILVADLMHQYNISMENVVQHNVWVTTSCPAVLKKKWNEFIGMVYCEYHKLKVIQDDTELLKKYQTALDDYVKIFKEFETGVKMIWSNLEG